MMKRIANTDDGPLAGSARKASMMALTWFSMTCHLFEVQKVLT